MYEEVGPRVGACPLVQMQSIYLYGTMHIVLAICGLRGVVVVQFLAPLLFASMYAIVVINRFRLYMSLLHHIVLAVRDQLSFN